MVACHYLQEERKWIEIKLPTVVHIVRTVNGKNKLDAKVARPPRGTCSMANALLPSAQSRKNLSTVDYVLIYHARPCRLPLIIQNTATMVRDCQTSKLGPEEKKHT